RQADVVHARGGRRWLAGTERQEVDQVAAAAEVDQVDGLVDVVHREAQHLRVEALGHRLIPHPEHDVVQLEALQTSHQRFPRGWAEGWRRSASRPTANRAMLTATARRCSRLNSSGARSPAGADWARSRAAWASGSSTWPAYRVPARTTVTRASAPHRSGARGAARASQRISPRATVVVMTPKR